MGGSLEYLTRDMERVALLIEDLEEQRAPVPAELEAEYSALADQVIAKCDAIGELITDWDEKRYACATRAALMRERAGRYDRRVERLKRYITTVMEVRGIKKLTGTYSDITYCLGPETVEVTGPMNAQYSLPPIPPQPDKRAILLALKAGESFVGARLVPGKPYVRVKT